MNPRRSLFFVGFAFLSFLVLFGCGSSDDPVATEQDEDCGISITMPAIGMGPWSYAEDLTLRWDKTGPADSVRIDLNKDSLLVGTIIRATANDGYYKWPSHTFDENSGSDYSISVTTLGESSCSDEQGPFELINTVGCNFNFTGLVADMADSLYLYNRDDILDITWDSFNTTGNVKIDLIVLIEDIGVISYTTPDDGHFSWPVTSFHNGSYSGYHFINYMIRISDAQLGGCSLESDYFNILDDDICSAHVTYPGEHDVLTEGQQYEIVFSMENMDGNSDLWLYAGLESVGYIASNIDPTVGRYTWTVDDFNYPGSNQNFRIRVISSDDPYCWDDSNDFTIQQP
jgi:hypothetical protein